MVRRPVPDDADELAACHVRCWRQAYAGLLSAEFLSTVRVEDRAQMWRQALRSPGSRRFAVAVVDEEIIGFAGARPSADEPPVRPDELWGLYLHADQHGSGLGQDLLDAVLPSGPASLWVAQENPRARAFHARNRFEPDGTRRSVAEWEDLPIVRLVR